MYECCPRSIIQNRITLQEALLALFDEVVEKSIQFLRCNCREAIPSVDSNLIRSLCLLLQVMCTFQEMQTVMQF